MSNTTSMIPFPTLQSKDGTMVVGFYPVVDSTRYTLKVLTWKGLDAISTKLLTNRDAHGRFKIESTMTIFSLEITSTLLKFTTSVPADYDTLRIY